MPLLIDKTGQQRWYGEYPLHVARTRPTHGRAPRQAARLSVFTIVPIPPATITTRPRPPAMRLDRTEPPPGRNLYPLGYH